MNIDELANKPTLAGVKKYRGPLTEKENSPFAEGMHEFRTKENNLYCLHADSEGKENLILIPALGRHTHSPRLMKFFSQAGFNTTTFHYSGTYKSWDSGKFIPTLDKKISIVKDTEEVIDSLHPEEKISLLAPCFGGQVAVNLALKRPEQIKTIYLFAPMLYGLAGEPWKGEKDKSLQLGYRLSLENTAKREYGPYNGTAKKEWYEKIWLPLIKGKSTLKSDRRSIAKLARSPVRVFGVAAKEDNLVSSKTLETFAKEYERHAREDDFFFYTVSDEKSGEHHYGHYAIEFAPGVIKTFFQFTGLDPLKIRLKRKTDLEFVRCAQDCVPAPILHFLEQKAKTYNRGDKAQLKKIVAEPQMLKKFSMGSIINGFII